MAISFDEVTGFLYGAGELLEGWAGTRADLVQAAHEHFPGKAFCLVQRWILVELPPDEVQTLTNGIAPMVIFAHDVIHDSRGRFAPRSWVRSTYGVSYDHPCMFETRSTVYLLIGDGYRKEAKLELVLSLQP
ncbi:DUF6957 family protein [Pseudomonas asiatica]|uniref:DUF6957 family protein n=1 Tax=Pseudomonas TaxID=286 RepID=UPI00051D29C3|nr:hypothetical protein GT93_00885 [Pseudomonas plecoglossicida]